MAIQFSHPTQILKGEISLTSSKSISNRVLIIQALCIDNFEIKNLAEAEDTQILQRLLNSTNSTLDVGLAGTTMRFLTAFLALQKGNFVLTGAERMQQRPIKILVDALRQIGATIEYLGEEGFPPLKITGQKSDGGIIKISGDISSQYISALLLIAPTLKNGLTLQLSGEIISKPYINMTISIMQHFGADVKWHGNEIVIKNGNYQAKVFTVEADWSAASYWYGMVALAKNADIKLYGLHQKSLQGDAVVQKIYEQFGVKTEFIDGGVHLTKSTNFELPTTNLTINFIDCPDIAQTVAVTCAALTIQTQLTGLKTLRIKETDRIAALQTELTQLGYNVAVKDDEVLIHPSKLLQNITSSIKTYNDHRMAMAFAPLGLLTSIKIEDENVVVKSYPNFWEDLAQLGFKQI